MKRNWHVICTQKKSEKKVSLMLTKKGFENFCPFTIIERKTASRRSKEYGPLFSSFVFVNVSEKELEQIKKLPNVVNPLYWGSTPAIINQDEINAIKMMTENYSSIMPEKIAVKANENIGIVERKITGYNNNVTTIKHQGITVTLPTLGFSLTSEREKEQTTAPVKKESLSSSLARRLNPLVLFGF